jgi:hypothetical protein
VGRWKPERQRERTIGGTVGVVVKGVGSFGRADRGSELRFRRGDDAPGLLAAGLVEAGHEDGVDVVSGLVLHDGFWMCGLHQDDAMDVGAGVALVGETGVDEAAQQLEERLDAADGLGPEADLGKAR